MDPNTPEDVGEVTRLLRAARRGDPDAEDEIASRLYDELREMASRLLQRERTGHTLQTTDLLHESLARLIGADAVRTAENSRHLFGMVKRAMQQVLIDHHRRRAAAVRGGDRGRVPLDDVADRCDPAADPRDFHDLVDRLGELDERTGRVVVLRFYVGLTVAEVADHLGISVTTAEDDWRFARRWLRRQLDGAGGPPAGPPG